MSADLTAGIVRILTPEDETTGTGFVVSSDGLIATCAHVVEAAGAGPGDNVRLVFHSTSERRDAKVELDWWRAPDGKDVAILRLEEPLPEGLIPLLLGSSGGTSGHAFKTFGFPAAKNVEGMWGYGELGDFTTEAGQRVLQLTGTTEVTLGFSGSPVLNTTTRRVVGMITSITVPDQAGRLAETAFIIPTETLRAVCHLLCLSDLRPYRGLAAFTEADAEFFFGREELVKDLVSKLRGSPRFLAVVGPSGSGKSSVLRAGLFPALHRGEVPGSAAWRVLSLRPGANPFHALTAVGLDITLEADPQTTVRAFLERCPETERLVLFVDQFEELFTLCSEPVCKQFLNHMLALVESDVPFTMILALRADFYGYVLQHGQLAEWLNTGQVNVPPMEKEDLLAAIEGPVNRVGLHFEPGLVENILEDTSSVKQPLPLLEATLTQLWGQREEGMLTHAAYQAVGRVASAISQWAEDTYSGLSKGEQSLGQRVFTRLLHYSEGEIADVLQRRPLADLVAYPEERESVHRLVQCLADARLLVTDKDPRTGEETVEIVHDALLSEWTRLRRWVGEQREFLLWRQRLNEQARAWEKNERDEGALLRGALLDEAEHWFTEQPNDLNLDEREYILDSVALRKRERAAEIQRRRRSFLGAVVGIAVITILVFIAVQRQNARLEAEATAEAARSEAVAEAAAHATDVVVRATVEAQAEEDRQTAEDQAITLATMEALPKEDPRIALARRLAGEAQDLTNDGGVVLSALLAVESLNHHSSPEGNGALRRALGLLPRSVARMVHGGVISAVAFSPDGRWLASGSWSNTVRVWEVSSGREVVQMRHTAPVMSVAFSPDGRWLASGCGHAKLHIWDTMTGQEVAVMRNEGPVWAVAFSPSGELVASAEYPISSEPSPAAVRVWRVATRQEVARKIHDDDVLAVAFSPDGRRVASGGFDNTLQIWDAATGETIWMERDCSTVGGVAFSPDGEWVATASGARVRIWEAATGRDAAWLMHDGVQAVAFSPNGRWVASGSADHTVRVWETAAWEEVFRIEHDDSVKAVAFSPDGQCLASGGENGIVHVWEMAAREEVARVEHKGAVKAFEFSPDGQWIVSGNTGRVEGVWTLPVDEYSIWVWEAATGRKVAQAVHEALVNDVAFSPDGQRVASASSDGTVGVWETASGQEVARMEHTNAVSAVAFSPDGRWVVSGGWDNTARVWESATGKEVVQMKYEDRVSDVAFSPNGQWIVSVCEGGTVWVWETATEQHVVGIAHEDEVLAVAFSPDSRWVASGGLDGILRVWEAATGREAARVEHNGAVFAVAFSPDGQWLASGSGRRSTHTAGGTIRVWRFSAVLETGAMGEQGQETVQEQLQWPVEAIAFSSDGRWLATGSGDPSRDAYPGKVHMWESATGREVAQMELGRAVSAVAFSPDAQYIAASSWDGTVRTWLWKPEDLIAEACARLPRNLTLEEWQMYLGDDEPYHPTCPNLPEE